MVGVAGGPEELAEMLLVGEGTTKAGSYGRTANLFAERSWLGLFTYAFAEKAVLDFWFLRR